MGRMWDPGRWVWRQWQTVVYGLAVSMQHSATLSSPQLNPTIGVQIAQLTHTSTTHHTHIHTFTGLVWEACNDMLLHMH